MTILIFVTLLIALTNLNIHGTNDAGTNVFQPPSIMKNDIPVDEDFESYINGSEINGQGDWYSIKSGSGCTSTVIEKDGSMQLELYDTTPPNSRKVECAMNMSSNAARIGFVEFEFETSDSTSETNILVSDGIWSEIGIGLNPNGSARIRVSSGYLFIEDGASWSNIAAISSNTNYVISVHYNLDAGWHIIINDTKYDTGGDYSYNYSFGTPTQINTFEITTGASDSGYYSYVDNIDLSSTPTDNAPSLNRKKYVNYAYNGSTMINFTANYSDLDNNPPQYVNLTLNATQYAMHKVNASDNNYTDGCQYEISMILNQTGNYTYSFTTSDSTNVTTTPIYHLEVITREPVFWDGMEYEWIGKFNWTNMVEEGIDTFSESSLGLFEIASFPGNSFTESRTINGSTRVIVNTGAGFWGPWFNSHEWTRLPIDIGVGSTIPITRPNGGDMQFNILEERFFMAMNRTFKCWYMEEIGGSKAYYDIYSGLLVNVTYITGWPTGDSTMQIRGTNVVLQQNTNAPEIVNTSLSPGSGDQSTLFTFNATIRDLDGLAPSIVKVILNGTMLPMSPADATDLNASDNMTYTYSTYLQPAQYEYGFYCHDGMHSNWTSTNTFTVASSNANPPSLGNSTVEPPAGYNNTTPFAFTINYTDPDNNQPSFVNLTVGGSEYSMYKVDPTDNNYMDGCLYTYSTFLAPAGNHSYHYNSSDGITAVGSGGYPPIVVNISNSPFKNDMLYEWDGWFKMAGFQSATTYQGQELFNQTGANSFHVISTPFLMMGSMERDVNGTTGEISNGNYPIGSIEWVKIPTNISIGSTLQIGVYNTWELETFMVTGEGFISAMGRSFDCWILEAAAGHYTYYDKYSGMLVNGTYHTPMGGLDEFSIQVRGTNIELSENQFGPVLTGIAVSPSTGNLTTEFTFNVTYTDLDNDAPEFVRVLINGTKYSMQKANGSDNDYTDGAVFTKSIYLSQGTYTYSFECSDWLSINTTTTFTGLNVTYMNGDAPTLQGSAIPRYGYNGSTIVTFIANYTDPNNNHPTDINVTVNATTYNMYKEDEGDTNFMDGCIFMYTIVFNTTGNYTYFFNASDGTFSTSDGPYADLEVEVRASLFFDGMIYNYTGYDNLNGMYFNATENCVDLGANVFLLNSSLSWPIWANRTVNGLTRKLTNDLFSDFQPGTHEWSRIFPDIGIGSSVFISRRWAQNSDEYVVTGETQVLAMGRTFEVWVLECPETGSIAYYDKYSSLMINGTFYFDVGLGSWDYYTFEITGTNVPLKPNLNHPALSSPSVSPVTGNQSTLFNFSVVYTDLDNNMPTSITVTINSTTYPMQKASQSENYSGGLLYTYTTTLAPGTYNYTYSCEDYAFWNATIWFTGLNVVETNTANPELVNASVSPNIGNNETMFQFMVQYKDADNNLPTFVNLSVNGSTFEMFKLDPFDNNAIDGIWYLYNYSLDYGTHSFQIFCSDGTNFNNTGIIPGPEVNPLMNYVNTTLFYDDFESGLSNWETPSGLWHITSNESNWPDSSHSPVHSMWFGSETWGTYETGSRTSGELITKPIDISGTGTAFLEFYHWKVMDAGWEESQVFVSVDGSRWDLIYSNTNWSVLPWERVVVDISDYAGNHSLMIKFWFDSKDAFGNNQRGWLIDDVRIFSNISTITALNPVPGANASYTFYNFTWTSLEVTPGPIEYTFQLSNSSDFSVIIVEHNVTETPTNMSYQVLLDYLTGVYFWRLQPRYGSFQGYSDTFNFTLPDFFPSTNFTENTTLVYQGDAVQFNFTGDPGNVPTTFQWDFGDGTPNSNNQNPTHIYNTAGNFTVTLVITDRDGDSDVMVKFQHINVIPDLIPVANFTANATVIEVGEFIQFNFTGTEGNLPTSFNWNFTDGSSNDTSRDPTHQFNSQGNYTIILTIEDANGDISTLTITDMILAVVNKIPIANFGSNTTSIFINEFVQFNFTGFEGDAPATFQWN
ncbi:MAG: PKD domain-containing protein, partial [Promethearchaeota archaeon]